MSLPSVVAIKRELGIDGTTLSDDQVKSVLIEAMRRDLPFAVALLHEKAHEAQKDENAGVWTENPNSTIGKQLIRLHASDALRPLASEYFCHGLELTFINCCNGKVGKKPPNVFALQIALQDGTIGAPDC